MDIKKLNEEFKPLLEQNNKTNYIVIYTDGTKDTNFVVEDNELFYKDEYIGDLMDSDDNQEIGEAIMDYAQLELNKEVEEIQDKNGELLEDVQDTDNGQAILEKAKQFLSSKDFDIEEFSEQEISGKKDNLDIVVGIYDSGIIDVTAYYIDEQEDFYTWHKLLTKTTAEEVLQQIKQAITEYGEDVEDDTEEDTDTDTVYNYNKALKLFPEAKVIQYDDIKKAIINDMSKSSYVSESDLEEYKQNCKAQCEIVHDDNYISINFKVGGGFGDGYYYRGTMYYYYYKNENTKPQKSMNIYCGFSHNPIGRIDDTYTMLDDIYPNTLESHMEHLYKYVAEGIKKSDSANNAYVDYVARTGDLS